LDLNGEPNRVRKKQSSSDESLSSDGWFDCSRALSRRCAPGQRIAVAFVQSENAVAVEDLLIDLQAGFRKKLGRELLDGETDGVRGAGESAVANGFSPQPSALCGEQLGLVPAGKQLRHGGVIKHGLCGLR
jgi:hypothetical protein